MLFLELHNQKRDFKPKRSPKSEDVEAQTPCLSHGRRRLKIYMSANQNALNAIASRDVAAREAALLLDSIRIPSPGKRPPRNAAKCRRTDSRCVIG